jgi:predicted double-glycine peptidase
VIDVVEWTTAFEHALDLPKLAYITTRIKRHFDVGAQTEAYFIGLMWQVTRDDMMAAITKLGNQASANRA